MATADDPSAALRMLVGREVSAVCFVRDYVELHFDGPILRALANPFGLYGCRGWRFPEGQSPILMRYYIGKVIDAYEPTRSRTPSTGWATPTPPSATTIKPVWHGRKP